MTGDTTDLDRTTLATKKRDELAAIVTALGGSPGSRDAKGALVDQIVDLAGGGKGNGSDSGASIERSTADMAPDNDTNDDDSSSVRADDRADSTDTGSESARRPSNPRRGSDNPSSDEANDEPSAKDGASDRSDKADGDRSDNDGGSGDRNPRNRNDQNGKGGENRGNQNRGGNQGGGQNKGGGQGGQNKGGNQGGGQNKGGGGGGGGNEPEAGNRRRRRRGKNRGGDGGPPEEEWKGDPVPVEGVLDLRDEGYGFLRVKGYLPTKDDVYVSVKQVRQFGLRKGDQLAGTMRPAGRNEKNPALLSVDKVNDDDPAKSKGRRKFEDLTPLFPDERLTLEVADDPGNMTARIMDLISPVGKGQRGLIVSPPKAGKTTVMKQIAKSIETNNPEVKLIVLLVDERPEEVTDMRRWVKGDVMASTFDRPSDEHAQVAELTLEKAKRMVEFGEDVVIILDGITRLARAYNLAAPATGRIMSGGVDSGALYPPKKFFGAARNLEEGGSLTILATALVETGSKMDEVIFEEFKGTGNMELRLDRRLADRRIYPAIDVDSSSTRHEELLFERKQLQQVWKLRRVLSGLGSEGGSGLELLIDRMKTFKSNDEFLAEVAKAPSVT
jgi:transcription termination factor Rho